MRRSIRNVAERRSARAPHPVRLRARPDPLVSGQRTYNPVKDTKTCAKYCRTQLFEDHVIFIVFAHSSQQKATSTFMRKWGNPKRHTRGTNTDTLCGTEDAVDLKSHFCNESAVSVAKRCVHQYSPMFCYPGGKLYKIPLGRMHGPATGDRACPVPKTASHLPPGTPRLCASPRAHSATTNPHYPADPGRSLYPNPMLVFLGGSFLFKWSRCRYL